MQQFMTDSPWDSDLVIKQVASDANEILPQDDRWFAVDESGFAKKGDKSVGVARQWNGRLGKVDNCQVGVFACLGSGNQAALVAAKLYLPEVWASDPDRCNRAKIPVEEQKCAPKYIMALNMVKNAREQGLKFEWVTADAGYGHNPAFLRELDLMKEVFMVDVHSNQRVYLENPRPYVPTPTSHHGRAPSRFVSDIEPVAVRSLIAEVPDNSWQIERIRDTTKGWLETRYMRINVWVWNGEEKDAQQYTLLIRCDKNSDGSPRLKYSLSNASADVPLARLGMMQAERFWIEDTFHNGKGTLGMGDYQTRMWSSWHHHMALVAMALLFMLEERQTLSKVAPMTSCNDIAELLEWMLPKKAVTLEDLIDQMDTRHRQRQASIDFAHRNETQRETIQI